MKTSRKRKQPTSFSVAHECIFFPSLRKSSYRVELKQNEDNNDHANFWVEDKKSKHQWSLGISDMKKHGPEGTALPATAVLGMLKKALDGAISRDENNEPDDPTVDAEISAQGLNVRLTFSLSGVWVPEFCFLLTPIKRERIDILEAQLRDAQEQIAELVQANERLATRSYFSIKGCNVQVSDNRSASWANIDDNDLVATTSDGAAVEVLRPGLYQIHTRYSLTEHSNYNFKVSLRVNYDEVGASAHCCGHTSEISELVKLNAGDILDVLYSCPNSGYHRPTSQGNARLWGLLLSES